MTKNCQIQKLGKSLGGPLGFGVQIICEIGCPKIPRISEIDNYFWGRPLGFEAYIWDPRIAQEDQNWLFEGDQTCWPKLKNILGKPSRFGPFSGHGKKCERFLQLRPTSIQAIQNKKEKGLRFVTTDEAFRLKSDAPDLDM